MSRTCPECGVRPEQARGLCNPCYRRLVWRPANGEAVERDRESSRRWKREHLGQPGLPKGAA